jgi:pyruvate/2-oxoglutarate/acetoin dehydrogenase E1 component
LLFAPAALLGQREEMTGREIVSLGVGAVVRPGSDLTIIALGRFVPDAVQVAELFATRGIDVEVIDPRSLLPMDWSLLTEHARATGRVVVVDDAPRTAGLAAEVAATLQAECWRDLKAPIARVCRGDGPIQFSPILENALLPDIAKIEAAVQRVIDFSIAKTIDNP